MNQHIKNAFNASQEASLSLLDTFGTREERVNKAVNALKAGLGIIVVDDEDRENEGDMIFSVDHLTAQQMALLIREGSGIVCLCIEEAQARQLELPPMVESNSSKNQTAFTVTIEAREGVSTGVSAKDRVTTIKTACHPNAKASDLARPGHVFPLVAKAGGVRERRGHTEATLDLMKLAGLSPNGVLCEVQKEDGEMARLPELVTFAAKHQMPIVSIEDLAFSLQATI
ncbi:3,4-dihydroxy-2-butanone-4-phosphate synthase [Pokkaliibacter sp. CJK22405]|uniref:3,4-dihydroxy-2-butanone-4-phosphate synthase n=1 Tax=Pokkaliibacter sp. CJK22405 TaxID=3384615 RepID=UPI003984B56D